MSISYHPNVGFFSHGWVSPEVPNASIGVARWRATQTEYTPELRALLGGEDGVNWRMPTDAERWRFLADHGLTLHTDGGFYGYMIHWCRTAGPGEPPKFYPVSNGKTAEEAIDAAIARWERKQRRRRRMDDDSLSTETIITE